MTISQIKDRLIMLEGELKLLKQALVSEVRKSRPKKKKQVTDMDKLVEANYEKYLQRIHKKQQQHGKNLPKTNHRSSQS